jgi:hypothetical protein
MASREHFYKKEKEYETQTDLDNSCNYYYCNGVEKGGISKKK